MSKRAKADIEPFPFLDLPENARYQVAYEDAAHLRLTTLTASCKIPFHASNTRSWPCDAGGREPGAAIQAGHGAVGVQVHRRRVLHEQVGIPAACASSITA